MIIRVRFFDDSKKAFITEWTLCKADRFVTLSTLYDNIYSGDIPCGLKVEITYDREKVWVESTSTNSNQPLTEELFNTPLEFTIGDLEDNRKITVRKYLLIILYKKMEFSWRNTPLMCHGCLLFVQFLKYPMKSRLSIRSPARL